MSNSYEKIPPESSGASHEEVEKETIEIQNELVEGLEENVASNLYEIHKIAGDIELLIRENPELGTEEGQYLLGQQLEKHDTEWHHIGDKAKAFFERLKSVGNEISVIPDKIADFLRTPGFLISSAISLMATSPAEAATRVLTIDNCDRSFMPVRESCVELGIQAYEKAFGHLPPHPGSGLYELLPDGLFTFSKFSAVNSPISLGQMDNLGVMHAIGSPIEHPIPPYSNLLTEILQKTQSIANILPDYYELETVGVKILTATLFALLMSELVKKFYYPQPKYPWGK